MILPTTHNKGLNEKIGHCVKRKGFVSKFVGIFLTLNLLGMHEEELEFPLIYALALENWNTFMHPVRFSLLTLHRN